MHQAFSLDGYHFELQSLPYWVAAFVIAVMIMYVALARGAPALRFSFMGICACIMPFVVGYALAASTDDMSVAAVDARIGTAFTPLSGAFVLMFDVSLARRLARYRRVLIAAFAAALAFAVLCSTTDWVTDGVWVTPAGVPFGTSGPLGWLSVTLVGVYVVIGTLELWRRLAAEPSARRRRQYRGAIWAFSVAALGAVDLSLGYELGYGPMSWFFLTVGALIALRSVAADELVGTATLDRGAFAAVAYLAAACAGAWLIGDAATGAALVVGLVALFLGLRAAAAVVGFLTRSDAGGDSPVDRAFERYLVALRDAPSVERVATATAELLELALGCERSMFLVPSRGDYSWRVAGGDPLIEEATPDPRLLGWLLTHPGPVARDDLVVARLAELREPMEWLFEVHGAEVMVPLASRDELVGLVVVNELSGGRGARPDELALLARLAEPASSAIVYAEMSREANARVEVDKEVELAAAVQEAFIPAAGARTCGRLLVTGRYAPASRCGGDWWSAHELSPDRTLVLVGDVTGHGVAAAMVTAAAKGCCDVALRLMGSDVELAALMSLLQRAVLRAGGTELYMTCFATLIDRGRGTVSYANAGHVVPYLRRNGDSSARLEVLVARGNPLGALGDATYRVHERPIGAGDVLVWYTDGIVECSNGDGQQLGDRRFQRMLRRVVPSAGDGADLDAVTDRITREATVFCDGTPPADDITLVVGCVL